MEEEELVVLEEAEPACSSGARTPQATPGAAIRPNPAVANATGLGSRQAQRLSASAPGPAARLARVALAPRRRPGNAPSGRPSWLTGTLQAVSAPRDSG